MSNRPRSGPARSSRSISRMAARSITRARAAMSRERTRGFSVRQISIWGQGLENAPSGSSALTGSLRTTPSNAPHPMITMPGLQGLPPAFFRRMFLDDGTKRRRAHPADPDSRATDRSVFRAAGTVRIAAQRWRAPPMSRRLGVAPVRATHEFIKAHPHQWKGPGRCV